MATVTYFFLYARLILIGSNTGIILAIPKTALYCPLAFFKDDVAYVTESARDELASLIASFNKAWNLVRLNLDQQGNLLLVQCNSIVFVLSWVLCCCK